MKKIFLLFLALFLANNLYAAKPKQIIKCKVYRIVDGDGFHCHPIVKNKVSRSDKNIRMIYIDAPERGQHYAFQARQHLSNLIKNKTVKLKIYAKDKYARTLAEVFYKGKNINKNMVKHGYAFKYYYNPPSQFEYERLENLARKAKIGIFSNPKYIRPNDWRKYHNTFKRPKNYK